MVHVTAPTNLASSPESASSVLVSFGEGIWAAKPGSYKIPGSQLGVPAIAQVFL